jgi:hypothetical protein
MDEAELVISHGGEMFQSKITKDNSRKISISLLGMLALALFAGCASSRVKARKETRDKMLQSVRLYCDFINGDVFSDIEVQLNIEMMKRCDPDKTYSITNYRTPAETVGITYCCTMAKPSGAPVIKVDGAQGAAAGTQDDPFGDDSGSAASPAAPSATSPAQSNSQPAPGAKPKK